MTTASVELEPLVEELIGVLDETIDLQQEVLEQLRAASETMLSRDDAAFGRLMEDLGRTPPRIQDVGRRRSGVRSRLAVALDCPVDAVTLEGLAGDLPEPLSGAVRRRRERIRRLAQTVRCRHLETAVLLAEVARVNRSLLLGLFPPAGEAGTYRTDGTTHWQPGHGLLDARL